MRVGAGSPLRSEQTPVSDASLPRLRTAVKQWGVRNMPSAELDIDAELVRTLLREQFPALASLPLTVLTNGWDNTLPRLGDDLLVRLPRRQ